MDQTPSETVSDGGGQPALTLCWSHARRRCVNFQSICVVPRHSWGLTMPFRYSALAAAAAMAIAAAPASAIEVFDPSVPPPPGEALGISVTCPDDCVPYDPFDPDANALLGLSGQVDGSGLPVPSSGALDPLGASGFVTGNSSLADQFNLLMTLIVAAPDIDIEDNPTLPDDSDKQEFGDDADSFSIGPGFFLVKWGGGGADEPDTAFFYTPFGGEIFYEALGGTAAPGGRGLSHATHFGGFACIGDCGGSNVVGQIPLPGALPLLGAGLAALGLLSGRRRRA